MLAQKIGSRWVIGIGIGMLGVLTLLTPLAANVSVWLLVVVRALEGAFVVRGTVFFCRRQLLYVFGANLM